MPAENKRARLQRYLLTLHYYYAIALGIISLRYDYRRRCFVAAPLRKLYALAVNALMVGVAPLALRNSMYPLNGMFGGNRLMRLTHAVNTFVFSLVVTLTLIFRWRRERHAQTFVEELLAIEADYFDAIAVPRHIERRFDRVFYAKYFCIFFQSVAVLYSITELRPYMSGWWALYYFYFHSTLNVLLGVMFHYFLALSHICKRFCILNVQLERIFKQLRQSSSNERHARRVQLRLAAEVHALTCLHYRLTQLVVHLNATYDFQILAVLLTHIINNTALGYYAVKLFFGGDTQDASDIFKIKFNYVDILFGIATYSAIMLDLFITDVTCDAMGVAYHHTGAILRQFNELDVLEESLAQSCHLLSQHLMQTKLRIRICGMFNISKHSSFMILGDIIEKVIILLQFDMEKRFG